MINMKNPIKSLNLFFKKYNLYLILTLILIIAIFILSVIPTKGGTKTSSINAHFIAYFTLSILITLYILDKYPKLIGPISASLYGFLIEIAQYFIPYRYFSLEDILLNLFASFIALIPILILANKRWI